MTVNELTAKLQYIAVINSAGNMLVCLEEGQTERGGITRHTTMKSDGLSVQYLLYTDQACTPSKPVYDYVLVISQP